MDSTRLRGYIALLRGTDPALLVEAINDTGKTEEFFPRPAKILERVRGIARGRELTQNQIPDVASASEEERAKVESVIAEFSERMGWK